MFRKYILFSFLLFLITESQALECYRCGASKDLTDPCFLNDVSGKNHDIRMNTMLLPKEQCRQPGDVCKKFTLRESGKDPQFILRGCSGSNENCNDFRTRMQAEMFKRLDLQREIAKCYSCTTEKCNSAFTVKPFSGLSFLALFLSIIYTNINIL